MRGFDHPTNLSPSFHGLRWNAWQNDPLLCPKFEEKLVADYESRWLRKRD